MTSFANKMKIFLWQIATVIPTKGTRTSVDMPGFEKKSLTITIVGGNDLAATKLWVVGAILCGECIH